MSKLLNFFKFLKEKEGYEMPGKVQLAANVPDENGKVQLKGNEDTVDLEVLNGPAIKSITAEESIERPWIALGAPGTESTLQGAIVDINAQLKPPLNDGRRGIINCTFNKKLSLYLRESLNGESVVNVSEILAGNTVTDTLRLYTDDLVELNVDGETFKIPDEVHVTADNVLTVSSGTYKVLKCAAYGGIVDIGSNVTVLKELNVSRGNIMDLPETAIPDGPEARLVLPIESTYVKDLNPHLEEKYGKTSISAWESYFFEKYGKEVKVALT